MNEQERQKIYEEERVRYEAQQAAKHEAKRGDYIAARILFFGGVLVVWLVLGRIFNG